MSSDFFHRKSIIVYSFDCRFIFIISLSNEMSERRLREIVRPNYCEDNSSPSPPKRNKWQNAGTVNHPSSSAKRDSSPKGKGLENAATTKIERKLPARCSITNENSSVAALVSTNCTLINRFAEQSKDLLKKADSILALQHSLHEEKAKNMKLNAAIIVKDKQIEDLQHQLKAMRDSQYCRDLICFDIEGDFYIP